MATRTDDGNREGDGDSNGVCDGDTAGEQVMATAGAMMAKGTVTATTATATAMATARGQVMWWWLK